MTSSATIVQISHEGFPVAKGTISEVAGYRVRVSVLSRKDRRLTRNVVVQIGSDVNLVFCSGACPSTPPIHGVIRSVKSGRTSTMLDIEIIDWDKLAIYWQMTNLKKGRHLQQQGDEASLA